MISPDLRQLTDAGFEGVDLFGRAVRLDVLRIAGTLITDVTLNKIADAFTAHGLDALPRTFDILNCTELTDTSINRIMVVDADERKLAQAEQRAPNFALTGLRVQEVDYELYIGEDPKKFLCRNGIRRSMFGEQDGMYFYKSDMRFASKEEQAQMGVSDMENEMEPRLFKWAITNVPDPAVIKVVSLDQPWKQLDEKQGRKKVNKGSITLEAQGVGETLIEMRWCRAEAPNGNCTRDEAINIQVSIHGERKM